MPHDQNAPGEIQRKKSRLVSFLMHFMLPLIALACGIAITFYLMQTSPVAKPRKRPPTPILVEVEQVVSTAQKAEISGMGEIIPAREIDLQPRVSGEVTAISPEFFPGGYFTAGQTMVSLDRTDYELVLNQLESEAARAESDLALEMGNQRIAEKEFALLGEQVSRQERDLILRGPQLAKLKATRAFAQSKLSKAKIDLERTKVEAPFNAVVTTRMVDVGAKISQSTTLARIVGTDAFWLKLSLPVEQLRWVRIPSSSDEAGSMVRIFPQGSDDPDSYRQGQVIRLVASLEEQGRMAQLLVKVDDPLCRNKENQHLPQLLLGSYVRAEVEGVELSTGIRIDRAHIHDGNTVWLMDENGKLDIRPVDILFRGRDHVVVNGSLSNGERLITSALSSPIIGIPLRLATEDVAAKKRQVAVSGGGRTGDKGQGRQSNAE